MPELPYDPVLVHQKITEWEHLAAALGEMADELADKVDEWRNRACDAEAQAVRLRNRLEADGALIDGQAPAEAGASTEPDLLGAQAAPDPTDGEVAP